MMSNYDILYADYDIIYQIMISCFIRNYKNSTKSHKGIFIVKFAVCFFFSRDDGQRISQFARIQVGVNKKHSLSCLRPFFEAYSFNPVKICKAV